MTLSAGSIVIKSLLDRDLLTRGTGSYGAVIHPNQQSGVSETKPLIANGDKAIASRIAHLLGRGRPATIMLRIRTIVVDALNRFTGWPFAHVRQEILELPPPGIYADAPTTIVSDALRI